MNNNGGKVIQAINHTNTGALLLAGVKSRAWLTDRNGVCATGEDLFQALIKVRA